MNICKEYLHCSHPQQFTPTRETYPNLSFDGLYSLYVISSS